MSLIIHRCDLCQHPDIWHDRLGDTCCFGQCRYGRHHLVAGPPEKLTTYTPDGAAVTRIEQPGNAFAGFGRGTVPLCGCVLCRSLYGSLVGDAA